MHSGGQTTSGRAYPLDPLEARIFDLKTLLGFHPGASVQASCLTEILHIRAAQVARECRVAKFGP